MNKSAGKSGFQASLRFSGPSGEKRGISAAADSGVCTWGSSPMERPGHSISFRLFFRKKKGMFSPPVRYI